METVKLQIKATRGCMVPATASLGCGLDCTPALSVTTTPLRQHMRQLWRLYRRLCHRF